jgi:hypothetical protein
MSGTRGDPAHDPAADAAPTLRFAFKHILFRLQVACVAQTALPKRL